VDQDVFTRYKAQHRAGWELAETAAYRPWLDTVFRGRVGVVSNENFYTLDHVRVELLASQWLQDCEASAGYRFTQFFADRDRAQAVDRHAVVVEFSRDMWCLDSHRVQLAVDFQHEFTRNVSSVYAGLIWHVGNNRRYRDFRPDAVGFRDLRERRAAEMLSNNRAWQME
jgi:hypothetical protein